VLALLNAGPDDFSFSVNVGDEEFGTIGAPSDQVKEAILASDEEVYLAIAETEGHWARPSLMDWSALLDHLDEIPDHIGSTGDVQILPWVGGTYVGGKQASVQEIELWRRNDNNAFGSLAHNGSGNSLGGRCTIRDGVIHLTGYRAAVKIIPPFARSSSACQSPNIYQTAVWVGALAKTFPKINLSKAAFMSGQQVRMLNEIRGNLKVAPVLEQYEGAKG
jgi:hypothetical protein